MNIPTQSSFCKHGYHLAIRCFQCESEHRGNVQMIPLKDHPLKDEVFQKIQDGVVSLSTPFEYNPVWNEETIQQLKKAIAEVRRLEAE